MKQENHLAIIIPVLNEEGNIEKAIKLIETHIHSKHTVFVIYDFPADRTIPVVEKLKKENQNIALIRNRYGRGVANAVKTGFLYVKSGVAVVMAPDLADDPKTILKMMRKIQGGADIVCATRYARGGRRLEQSSFKAFLSKCAGISTPLVLGIQTTDLTNGFKMYKKTVMDAISIESKDGWDFAMEIIIKAFDKGFIITEVPTISKKRIHGKSKFKLFYWLPNYIHWYIYALWLRLKRALNRYKVF